MPSSSKTGPPQKNPHSANVFRRLVFVSAAARKNSRSRCRFPAFSLSIFSSFYFLLFLFSPLSIFSSFYFLLFLFSPLFIFSSFYFLLFLFSPLFLSLSIS